MLAVLFMAGIAIAALLTVGGVHWLAQQIDLASNFKSSVVTLILGLGLVLVGPVLLWALATLLPRWWFKSMKDLFTRAVR